jgi:4-amino-4-deoxy-L-arabinose transferase-like glycosyltransferase
MYLETKIIFKSGPISRRSDRVAQCGISSAVMLLAPLAAIVKRIANANAIVNAIVNAAATSWSRSILGRLSPPYQCPCPRSTGHHNAFNASMGFDRPSLPCQVGRQAMWGNASVRQY